MKVLFVMLHSGILGRDRATKHNLTKEDFDAVFDNSAHTKLYLYNFNPRTRTFFFAIEFETSAADAFADLERAFEQEDSTSMYYLNFVGHILFSEEVEFDEDDEDDEVADFFDSLVQSYGVVIERGEGGRPFILEQ